MPTAIAADPPPLTVDDTDTIRVGLSRLPLDVLLAAHVHWGWSADRIASEFAGLTLADTYAALAYYHRHPAEVDAYLARRRAEADAIRAGVEARQGPPRTRRELLTRRTFRPGDRVPVSGIWRAADGSGERALAAGGTFPPAPEWAWVADDPAVPA